MTTSWIAGTRCALTGLAKSPQLNGTMGTVVGPAADDVDRVRFQLDATGKIVAVKKANLIPQEMTSVSAMMSSGPSSPLPPTPAGKCFYDPLDVCPELRVLTENYDVLVEEMQAATNFQAWPETSLYKPADGDEWKVIPFVHTFPADDDSQREWIGPNCEQCPRTAEILKSIPSIRTALYSRMGPDTTLSPHQGWAVLSNHVLRCHVALVAPETEASGVGVVASASDAAQQIVETRHHAPGELIMFDDSRMHFGFNRGSTHRCVLIVDVMRPDHIPKGVSMGQTTPELLAYIDYFRGGGDSAKLAKK